MNDQTLASPPPIQRCKICGGEAHIQFGLPHNKKASLPIPDEPDDSWYYQCTVCEFLFTPVRDSDEQSNIYDDTYWANQDPDWYGRVTETFRLVSLANELLKRRLEDLDILDFGCGMGAFVHMGRRSLQLNVWGTDIIKPKVGTEFFLPDLHDRRFDVITCCEVVEHFPEPRQMFNFMRRHLKSPGVLAFQTAEWEPSLGREWWYLGPHNGHISLYARRSLDLMFREMGGSERRIYRDYAGVQAWLFG